MRKKENKEYKSPEQFPEQVSEPMAVYNVDVNAIKLRVMEGIMLLNDKDKLQKLEKFLLDLCMPVGTPPCRFNEDELLEQIETAREAYKNGEVVTWEELQEKWKTW